MSKITRWFVFAMAVCSTVLAQPDTVLFSKLNNIQLYPALNDRRPDLPSPFVSETGEEYIVAYTQYGKYAVIPVTLSNKCDIGPQLYVDTLDFPLLAQDGLHSLQSLHSLTTITGWDLDTITALGRPGNLSEDGFMASDEDIRSILLFDNSLVTALGLTHPELAKPLFHLMNMMSTDMKLKRWNYKKHTWDHIRYFYYNGHEIYVEVEDTKGGQRSIFNDGIEGAYHIQLRRKAEPQELALLAQKYNRLSTEEYELLKKELFTLTTGEMEPQYIMRYGFYEGHTYWRTDPVAIALLFGLKDLASIEDIFKGGLYDVMTEHAGIPPQKSVPDIKDCISIETVY